MGYTTEFQGQFVISPPLADDEIEELNRFCENPKGDALPGHNCDWVFRNIFEEDELTTIMEWNGMEKSYFMLDWALYLYVHFFNMREIKGVINARGEEFNDVWHMVADGKSISRREGWTK